MAEPSKQQTHSDLEQDSRTSPSLLEGLRARDNAAWERIVEIWTPLIYGRCRHQGFLPEEANDITQNVFVRVYSGFSGFEHDGKGKRFRFWISKILHNEIAGFCQKRSQQPQPAGGTDYQAVLNNLAAYEEESSVDWCQPAQIVARFLDVIQGDFEPHTWEAFRLVWFDGLSNKEAGEKTGLKPEAVRQATYRIRQRLKAELDAMLS